MIIDQKEVPPIVYRQRDAVEAMPMGATYGQWPVALSEEEVDMLGLVGFDAAIQFVAENSPPLTTSMVAKSWKFLARQVFQENGYFPRPSEEAATEVRKYLFTPDFIIATARRSSGHLNASYLRSYKDYNRKSATFLVEFSNKKLEAEPPIPRILHV